MEIYEYKRLDYLFSVETILHIFLGILCLIAIYRSSCKSRQLRTFAFASLVSVGLIAIYPLYAITFWDRYQYWERYVALIALEQAIQQLPILILFFLALKRVGKSSSRYVGLNLD